MYSLAISNLSRSITEEDIVSHFNKLAGGKDHVVSVSLAYDNIEDIQECIARGDIIRKKIHLVHVCLLCQALSLIYVL